MMCRRRTGVTRAGVGGSFSLKTFSQIGSVDKWEFSIITPGIHSPYKHAPTSQTHMLIEAPLLNTEDRNKEQPSPSVL